MDAVTLKQINAARRERRAVALVTDLADGSGVLIGAGQAAEGELGAAVGQALRDGRSRQVEIKGRRHFVNVYLPPPRLVIIGAVHVSQALAPMARLAGFTVEIIDPRSAFATPERFPQTRLTAAWPDKAIAQTPLDAYTALAALTHDPRIDDAPLLAALDAGCFYVGALGSRRTHAARLERLAAAGAEPASLARIEAPIGLDIGAVTPAEIAVAVLGSVIRALRSQPIADPE